MKMPAMVIGMIFIHGLLLRVRRRHRRHLRNEIHWMRPSALEERSRDLSKKAA